MSFKIPLRYILIFLVLIAGSFIFFSLFNFSFKPKNKLIDSSNANKKDTPIKEFSVTARQFSFSPGTINVSYGERVKLKVKSVDVAHGISLPDFGVNEFLEPGKEIVIDFVANKKGTFSFFL